MSQERVVRGLVSSQLRLIYDHYRGQIASPSICRAFQNDVAQQVLRWREEGVFPDLPSDPLSHITVRLVGSELEMFFSAELQAALNPVESGGSGLSAAQIQALNAGRPEVSVEEGLTPGQLGAAVAVARSLSPATPPLPQQPTQSRSWLRRIVRIIRGLFRPFEELEEALYPSTPTAPESGGLEVEEPEQVAEEGTDVGPRVPFSLGSTTDRGETYRWGEARPVLVEDREDSPESKVVPEVSAEGIRALDLPERKNDDA